MRRGGRWKGRGDCGGRDSPGQGTDVGPAQPTAALHCSLYLTPSGLRGCCFAGPVNESSCGGQHGRLGSPRHGVFLPRLSPLCCRYPLHLALPPFAACVRVARALPCPYLGMQLAPPSPSWALALPRPPSPSRALRAARSEAFGQWEGASTSCQGTRTALVGGAGCTTAWLGPARPRTAPPHTHVDCAVSVCCAVRCDLHTCRYEFAMQPAKPCWGGAPGRILRTQGCPRLSWTHVAPVGPH